MSFFTSATRNTSRCYRARILVLWMNSAFRIYRQHQGGSDHERLARLKAGSSTQQRHAFLMMYLIVGLREFARIFCALVKDGSSTPERPSVISWHELKMCAGSAITIMFRLSWYDSDDSGWRWTDERSFAVEDVWAGSIFARRYSAQLDIRRTVATGGCAVGVHYTGIVTAHVLLTNRSEPQNKVQ